jgi:hypothetical protein
MLVMITFAVAEIHFGFYAVIFLCRDEILHFIHLIYVLEIHPFEDVFDDGLRFAGIEDSEILIVSFFTPSGSP